MTSKVLLVNFSKKEAEALNVQYPSLIFERGFFGSGTEERFGKQETITLYHFPHTLHEYALVFVNLDKNVNTLDGDPLERVEYSRKLFNDFLRYYKKQGTIIFLMGDYPAEELSQFALPQIILDQGDRDEKISFVFKDETALAGALEKMTTAILLPPKKYIREIRLDENNHLKFETFWSGTSVENIYENNSKEVLASVLWIGQSKLGCLFLPQFTDNVKAIITIIPALASDYPEKLSNVLGSAWHASDALYHEKFYEMQKKEQQIKDEYEKKIEQFNVGLSIEKKSFEDIRNLLIQKDDELKDTVYKVLKEFCGADVEDVDKTKAEKKETTNKEDLKVVYSGISFAVEVKGTDAKNPPEKFITQLLGHMRKGSYEKGILIVNYDIKTAPDRRPDAYTGESSSVIGEEKDVLFIDTRVLYRVCKDVFEKKITSNDAQDILFSSYGKITYSGKQQS